jgi:hypothetical protein
MHVVYLTHILLCLLNMVLVIRIVIIIHIIYEKDSYLNKLGHSKLRETKCNIHAKKNPYMDEKVMVILRQNDLFDFRL